MTEKKASKTPNVTYRDIAKHCGLSPMTVSRALRNQGYVKESTRNRVLQAVEDLQYKPNPLIQTLMSDVRRRAVTREGNIAWVAPYNIHKPHSPNIETMMEAARDRADRFGFGLEVVSIEGKSYTSERLTRVFRARGVVGAVVGPLRVPGSELPLPWNMFPYATIGRSLTRPYLHYTMAHFHHNMERVLKELRVRGYRRPAFVEDSYMQQRQDYTPRKIFEAHQYNLPPSKRIDPVLHDGWTRTDMGRWMEKNRPDAVISSSPRVLDMIRRLGCQVPNEVGFVTLTWRPQAAECSGIRQAFTSIGSGTVDLILGQLHRNERGIPERQRAMLFEGDWIEGSTLRPFSTKDH